MLAFYCLDCRSLSLFKEADSDSVIPIQDTESFEYVTTGSQLGASAGDQEVEMLVLDSHSQYAYLTLYVLM